MDASNHLDQLNDENEMPSSLSTKQTHTNGHVNLMSNIENTLEDEMIDTDMSNGKGKSKYIIEDTDSEDERIDDIMEEESSAKDSIIKSMMMTVADTVPICDDTQIPLKSLDESVGLADDESDDNQMTNRGVATNGTHHDNTNGYTDLDIASEKACSEMEDVNKQSQVESYEKLEQDDVSNNDQAVGKKQDATEYVVSGLEVVAVQPVQHVEEPHDASAGDEEGRSTNQYCEDKSNDDKSVKSEIDGNRDEYESANKKEVRKKGRPKDKQHQLDASLVFDISSSIVSVEHETPTVRRSTRLVPSVVKQAAFKTDSRVSETADNDNDPKPDDKLTTSPVAHDPVPVQDEVVVPIKRGRKPGANKQLETNTNDATESNEKSVVEATVPKKRGRKPAHATTKTGEPSEETEANDKSVVDTTTSVNGDVVTPKKRGRKPGLKKANSKSLDAENGMQVNDGDMKTPKRSRQKLKHEKSAVYDHSETEADVASSSKKVKNTSRQQSASATRKSKTTTPTTTPNTKNLFFMHSKSATKRPQSTSTSNLSIGQAETPKQTIKLHNQAASSDEENEQDPSALKKPKTLSTSYYQKDTTATSLSSSLDPLSKSTTEPSSTIATKKKQRRTLGSPLKPLKPIKQLKPETQPTRQSGRNFKQTASVKVMSTGIMLTEKDQQIVTLLGGKLTNNVKDCTHLVANTMIKSIKFLSCLNRGVHIVNELWLHESYRAKMFMNPSGFLVQDAGFEKANKFSLKTSLLKAKQSPLLAGWKFFILHEAKYENQWSVKELEMLIECANGQVDNKVPESEDEFIDYCVLFSNEEEMYAYKGIGADSLQLLKMTVETFEQCLFKQQFPIV